MYKLLVIERQNTQNIVWQCQPLLVKQRTKIQKVNAQQSTKVNTDFYDNQKVYLQLKYSYQLRNPYR